MDKQSVLISGGGTGGHIFPALAIANTIREKHKNINILFVGAKGKMEMQKVPAHGYEIIGLPIRGIQRKFSLNNLKVPFLLLISLWKAYRILKTNKPKIVIGVGGYASAPLLWIASMLNIPTLIQEQNSYPGITNKILAKKVSHICVAYPEMEKFFPKEKIKLTGNPIRHQLLQETDLNIALDQFHLSKNKKVILAIGGSLGARTINKSIEKSLAVWTKKGYQVIWQTGVSYATQATKVANNFQGVFTAPFIKKMQLAYKAADLVISRAGALSVSEIQALGKASILIPSPNVSEDHQTKNAQALVNKKAAYLIKDKEATEELTEKVIEIFENKNVLHNLRVNVLKMSKTNASSEIYSVISPYLK